MSAIGNAKTHNALTGRNKTATSAKQANKDPSASTPTPNAQPNPNKTPASMQAKLPNI